MAADAGVLHGWIDRVFVAERMAALSIEEVVSCCGAETFTTGCDETAALPHIGQTVLLHFSATAKAPADDRDIGWAGIKRGLHVEIPYSDSHMVAQGDRAMPLPRELPSDPDIEARVLVYSAAAVHTIAPR